MLKVMGLFHFFFGGEVLGGRENSMGSRKQTKHSEKHLL